jgi:hypothetical protein
LFPEDNRSESSEESRADLPELELAISTIPHSFPRSHGVLADPLEQHSLTRTSSVSSIPCLSFEESWFLTPPPCFTSEGPVHMETSPMENLLIEHPSMSVYQNSLSLHFYLPRQRRRSGSTDSVSGSPASSVSGDDTPSPHLLHAVGQVRTGRRSTVQATPRQRPAVAISVHQQQEKECVQLRSAQKVSITACHCYRGA